LLSFEVYVSGSEAVPERAIMYVLDSMARLLIMLPVNVSSRILHMPITSSAMKFPQPFEKLVEEGLLFLK
jgi:hypothetical protein